MGLKNFLDNLSGWRLFGKTDAKRLPDIANDRRALKPLLQGVIRNLHCRNIREDTWPACYVDRPKFQFEYDAEWRECVVGIRHSEEYELFMQVKDAHWNDKEYLICRSARLADVVRKLDDRGLANELHSVIYRWEEGEGVERIVVPEGTMRLAPMVLELGTYRRERVAENASSEEYPLYKYGRIGTLVIPSSLEILHKERCSPFAAYKQRGFVWNHPTEWQKVRIDGIENHSPHLLVEDGVLYSADRHRLIFCFEEKSSFEVPKSVTAIEPFAFCLQKRLEEIRLHDGITSIGEAAFMGCQSLAEMAIPSQMKAVADDTFDGCTSLRSVRFPEGLEQIGYCAFRQCRSLRSIELPAGIKSVRGFEGCSGLTKIDIPASVERISDFMFCSALRKVVLHEGVKQIAGYAFRYCDNLSEINFPEGLECIGERAFYPSSLRKLVFPKSLQKIGCEAFYTGRRLRSVKFKSVCPCIEQAAFACCPHLSRSAIVAPAGMHIADDVFIRDEGLDKYGFWD